jgi:hypothetical protein
LTERGGRAKLESKITSMLQAWVSRKIMVTFTELSKSAVRAGGGGEMMNFNLDMWSLKCH